MVSAAELRTGEVLRPLWRRARFWVVVGAGLLVAGFLLALISSGPGRNVDPTSPAKNGSKALAQVLRGYGTTVDHTTQLSVATAAGADTSVVVVEPDAYSRRQLAALLERAGRVVLLAPDAQGAGVDPALHIDSGAEPTESPDCSDAGARAAGPVDLPDATTVYRTSAAGSVACYGGALVLDGRLAALGSADLLRNDTVDHRGVAALDVNVLTASRTIEHVLWLLPGTDAEGPGAPSVWQLFPRPRTARSSGCSSSAG